MAKNRQKNKGRSADREVNGGMVGEALREDKSDQRSLGRGEGPNKARTAPGPTYRGAMTDIGTIRQHRSAQGRAARGKKKARAKSGRE